MFDTRAVPDDKLRNMTSVMTVVDGDIVHDTGELGRDKGRRGHDDDWNIARPRSRPALIDGCRRRQASG